MTKEVVIPLVTKERDDGSYGVTSPLIPMFHVVGADEPAALKTAVGILKEHLEKNYQVEIRRIRLADATRELFPDATPTAPAHVIAELAA